MYDDYGDRLNSGRDPATGLPIGVTAEYVEGSDRQGGGGCVGGGGCLDGCLGILAGFGLLVLGLGALAMLFLMGLFGWACAATIF